MISSVRVVGLIADLLVRDCCASTVERLAFVNGCRYAVRFLMSEIEVHLVDRKGRVFAEFWLSNYATPVMIVEYPPFVDPHTASKELCEFVRVLMRSLRRKRPYVDIAIQP